MFPIERPRRLRKNETLRALVRETHIRLDQLIYPVFVRPGTGMKLPVSSMPGIYQWSVDLLTDHLEEVYEQGIRSFLFFGIPAHKDAEGSEAYSPEGIVQVALQTVKKRLPEAVLIADLCLCEYTDHGHCGILRGDDVDNDMTIDILAKTAVVQARAGASIVAPSDMMDGRVAAIRHALDQAGFQDIPIMSYAAKYASGFYGPFREAAENTPSFGDRRAYQMDPANRLEALKEVLLDIQEGADMVIVKPAMPYLDVLSDVKNSVQIPVAAYQVSGEYAMIKAASQLGWLDERRVVEESLLSIKRAGADMIITYFAPLFAHWMQQK
ncbi:porphobilinogen synthase [Sulfobacillus thermosulfidooxidans]|uniref:Delta-aminolevulinic acid dehydratase n=1 Tax=Sulfobacillus thermosulfidooxidans TaxID=28034 RepID=A0A1R0IQ27_SULTH|nr:porphobilinogen synthase [Sulfobacillus thermosulfidooxidans]OLZ09841.1 delta-aminolevulinic acid dehydratase [Sulfobacillus thermosulfidooxidans]OLZ15853.1 delta-aminolevulinic acid dehydratase [Sulfobacillus thermosulfidooxidans]OLZ18300.1 delta-aminolevulinic acid dehydratase [Sulfobacillus thermosulfidooxidans]PSR24267.1 MAG: porphobilinogen synthase [Sulfobacillus thermosulfidooxidans]